MMLDEHEDVVDVDVDLLDELHFKDEVIRDRFLIRLFAFWGVGVVLAWGRGLPDD